jgi:hypothetical protein
MYVGNFVHLISYIAISTCMVGYVFPNRSYERVDLINSMRQLGEVALCYGTMPFAIIIAVNIFHVIRNTTFIACPMFLC